MPKREKESKTPAKTTHCEAACAVSLLLPANVKTNKHGAHFLQQGQSPVRRPRHSFFPPSEGA